MTHQQELQNWLQNLKTSKPKIQKLHIPQNKRIICISDIHGCLDLFKQLLEQINFCGDNSDILILLGDMYTKGPHGHDTLKYIMELDKNPNVYPIMGNCDWPESYLNDTEKAWLADLPHIIESDDYIFVHGGIRSSDFEQETVWGCMKNDCFMEQGLSFDKYIVTGHWPTDNYCHQIACCNPIVDEKSRIIAIDGGMVIRGGGQLNAFIIQGGVFSFESIDALPTITATFNQSSDGGHIHATWNDRFIELVEEGEKFSKYRHIASGHVVPLPNEVVRKDASGNLWEASYFTDYFLPIEVGDVVSVVKDFGDLFFGKKGGVCGWVLKK